MKKNKFLTTICMLSTFIGTNLHAKTAKGKKTVKAKTSHKPLNSKKDHSNNSGIYGISSNNKSTLVETKMAELRQKHTKAMTSGSIQERKRAAVEKKLLTSYSKWRGTKYSLGGDSRKGIDCSALTRRVYREVFNKELPRVSTQQVKQGTRVSAKNLRSGDIVYFKPENRTSHTAVYVGNTLFINASSSKGVVMSSLKSPYWRKYFKYSTFLFRGYFI